MTAPPDGDLPASVPLHEATRTGGIGAEIAAVLSERCFEYLDGPLIRVTAPDTPACGSKHPHALLQGAAAGSLHPRAGALPLDPTRVRDPGPHP